MNLNPFYKNPADKAMPYFEKIPGTIKPYYDDYINQGKQSLGTLMSKFQELIGNPSGALSSISEGYTRSPGYNFQMNEGINAANNAAAAGGMLGTPYHQRMATQVAEGVASKDFETWLAHALGLLNTGLAGEGDINNLGYRASDDLATSLGNNLKSEGGLAYNRQAESNKANGDFMSNIMAALTGGYSAYKHRNDPNYY